jgi:hypothetical protein
MSIPEYQGFLIVRLGGLHTALKFIEVIGNPQIYRTHALKETCWVQKLQKRCWQESRSTKE